MYDKNEEREWGWGRERERGAERERCKQATKLIYKKVAYVWYTIQIKHNFISKVSVPCEYERRDQQREYDMELKQ